MGWRAGPPQTAKLCLSEVGGVDGGEDGGVRCGLGGFVVFGVVWWGAMCVIAGLHKLNATHTKPRPLSGSRLQLHKPRLVECFVSRC